MEMLSGFLQGWLMETNVSLSQRHLGHSNSGVRTTQSTGLCWPSWARAALARQHCVAGRHCAGKHPPAHHPLHPGLAGKIIHVSRALNNVGKPVLHTREQWSSQRPRGEEDPSPQSCPKPGMVPGGCAPSSGTRCHPKATWLQRLTPLG